MNTANNDVTGDRIVTKNSSKAYRDNWDKIFKKENKDGSRRSKEIDKDNR